MTFSFVLVLAFAFFVTIVFATLCGNPTNHSVEKSKQYRDTIFLDSLGDTVYNSARDTFYYMYNLDSSRRVIFYQHGTH